MSPISALLLNRLINDYCVYCAINGILTVILGREMGEGGLASAPSFTSQSRKNFNPNDYREFNEYIQSIYESQNPNTLHLFSFKTPI